MSDSIPAPNVESVADAVAADSIRPKGGKVVACNDGFEVVAEIIDPAKDEYDVDVVALWEHNTKTDKYRKILQTVRDPKMGWWYVGDGDRFIPVSIDSIPVSHSVYIPPFGVDKKEGGPANELTYIIVEGCTDLRNIYSYVIDLTERKAWYVPANAGYMGCTMEEYYLVFQSYRYNSSEDEEFIAGGRHTFIQVFNREGKMVKGLSLEKLDN